MNRLGVKKKTEFLQMLRIIQKTPKIALIGVFTHFSTIQNDQKFLQKQGRRLRRTGRTPIDDDEVFVKILKYQGVFE